MSYKNGLQYTDFKKINIKDGILRFDDVASAPTSATGEYILYMSGGVLYFDNGSSAVALGAGGGSVGSLDGAYDGGRTITVNQGAVTLNGVNEDTAVLALTGDGDSAGALLTFSQSGSGLDVLGSGSTWQITKAGVITATGLTMLDSEVITLGTGSDATIQWDGSKLAVTGVVDFAGNITVASAVTLTMTGAGGSTIITLTAGDVVLSDSSLSITDADNAETVTIINNTATTIGASASAGVVQIESTSLTTGALLNLQLTEGTLNGGWYIRAWDATAGAAVFSVGEDGEINITGTAAGTDALTITAGDILLTSGHLDMTVGDMTLADGSLSITDADNAASLTVTNNTATSASAVVLAGSGVFTGNTTSSWMTITPSGLTTGTGVYGVFAELTTGKGVHLATDATQTTGSTLYVQNTGADSAITSGTIASFDLTSTAITSTVNKIGAVLSVTSSRTTTTGAVADDFDLMSIVRTSIINGAGSMSSTGSVLYIENAVTNTSGTVTDTANGLEVVMDSLGTGTGVKVTHSATGGSAIAVTSASTSVSSVLITGTGVIADNKGVLEVIGSGAIASGGAVARFSGSGTPAANTSAVVEATFTGTATNNPVVMFINNGTADAAPLLVNSNVAAATRAAATIVQDSTTGAIEVLALQQDDLDVPFIEFVTTIGTGNAIEAVAAKSLTTTHFVMVKIPGGLTRYFPVGTIA